MSASLSVSDDRNLLVAERLFTSVRALKDGTLERAAAYDGGDLKLALDVLSSQHFEDEAGLQRAACETIALLTSSCAERAQKASEMGVVRVVTSAMRRNEHDEAFARFGCTALRNQSNVTPRDEWVRSGALEVILTCLIRCRRMNANVELRYAAVDALNSLAEFFAASDWETAHAAERIVETLDQWEFLDDHEVQSIACELIHTIACCHVLDFNLFGKRLLHFVVGAMRAHPTRMHVQNAGVRALSTIILGRDTVRGIEINPYDCAVESEIMYAWGALSMNLGLHASQQHIEQCKVDLLIWASKRIQTHTLEEVEDKFLFVRHVVRLFEAYYSVQRLYTDHDEVRKLHDILLLFTEWIPVNWWRDLPPFDEVLCNVTEDVIRELRTGRLGQQKLVTNGMLLVYHISGMLKRTGGDAHVSTFTKERILTLIDFILLHHSDEEKVCVMAFKLFSVVTKFGSRTPGVFGEVKKLIAKTLSLETVVSAMRKHPQCHECQVDGCEAFFSIIKYVSALDLQIDVETCNYAVQLMLVSIPQYLDKQDMLRDRCVVLSHLLEYEHIREQASVVDSACQIMLDVMDTYVDDAELQHFGCESIERVMCTGNTAYFSRHARSTQCVLRALEQHKYNSEIQVWGCRILGKVARNDSREWSHHILQLLLDITERCMNKEEVLMQSLFQIDAIVLGNQDAIQRAIDSGVLKLVQMASQIHVHDCKVVSCVVRLLGTVCSSLKEDYNGAYAVSHSMLPTVLKAARLYSSSEDIQPHISRLLYHMCRMDQNSLRLALRNGVLELLLESMKIHTANAAVQWQAIRLLDLVFEQAQQNVCIERCNEAKRMVASARGAHASDDNIQRISKLFDSRIK